MNPEEKSMLMEALTLSRENNQILKKMYRASLWSRGIKVFYWVIIIGITIGSFYFLQPYIDTLQGVYGGVTGAQEQFKGLFKFIR